MTDQPPPPPGGYPPPPPPPPGGGYQPPPPPPGGGYQPPPPPPGGGYQPPPPPGGYPPPPPPGGGHEPPPPGSYPPPPGGYPPPPPPGGGYAPPPGGGYAPPPGYGAAQQFSIGDGLSWAWNQFTTNAVPLLVATVVYGVIIGVIYGIVYGLAFALAPDSVTSYNSYGGGFDYQSSTSFGAGSIAVMVIGGIILFIVVAAIQSAYIAGLLDIANGQQVSIGSFFKPRSIGNVILATVIIGVLTSIGYALCVLPGVAVAIFTMFAIVALLDRNLSAIDSIKASFEIAKANFVQVLLTWLVIAAIGIVGALVCGVGLLVAVPVAALLEVFAYRRLSGGQVALNPQPLPPGPPPQAAPPPATGLQ